MKYLYKYPQREFPYRDLVETNGRRTRNEFEYELLDTGVFDDWVPNVTAAMQEMKGDPESLTLNVGN